MVNRAIPIRAAMYHFLDPCMERTLTSCHVVYALYDRISIITSSNSVQSMTSHLLLLFLRLLKRQPSTATLHRLRSHTPLPIIQHSHQPLHNLPAIRHDGLALQLPRHKRQTLQGAGAHSSRVRRRSRAIEQARDERGGVLGDEGRVVHKDGLEDGERGGLGGLVGGEVEGLQEWGDEGGERGLEDGVGEVGEEAGEGEEVVCFGFWGGVGAQGGGEGRDEGVEGFLLVEAGNGAVVLLREDVVWREEGGEEAGAGGSGCGEEVEEELEVRGGEGGGFALGQESLDDREGEADLLRAGIVGEKALDVEAC